MVESLGSRRGKLDIEEIVKRLVGQSVYIPPFAALQVTMGDVFDQGSVVLTGRVLGSDGVLRSWGTTVDPPTRALSSTLHVAPEGWVVSMCARAESAVMSGSEAFVSIDVLERQDSSAPVLGTVLSGYCEQGGELSFPSGRFRDGQISNLAGYSIGLSNPGAGSNLSESFDTLGAKILRGFCCILLTDANVATRQLQVKITDQQGGTWTFQTSETQTATQLRVYVFTPAWADIGVVQGTIMGMFAPLSLQAGWTLETVVSNLQAGDQLSGCTINGEFYFGSSV